MKFEVRLSAPCGDVVPLLKVADAKARLRATAGGTDFHEPAYTASLQRFADNLLRQARCGRLKVCDHWGSPGEADALIAEAAQSGQLALISRYPVKPDFERSHRENEPLAPVVNHLAHLDLDPSEVDWTWARLSALSTTLKWLNEWGESAGDEFAVTHEGVEWVDERGIHRPTEAGPSSKSERSPGGTKPAAVEPVQAAAGDEKPPDHWKMKVQVEAAAEWKRQRAMNCNPTRASIRLHLLKWCKENNILTASRINPSDGYLRTHVLSGKHWTPPVD